jgi:tRNA pseudouridine55 synthase
MFDGLLLVDKPKGWTSFDVVAKVRGVLRAEAKKQGLQKKIKVGHTGTLDPMATGLLVLAVGAYTKKVPELTKQDKWYEAAIILGGTTATDDAEGEVVAASSFVPKEARVLEVIQRYTGELLQVPPQFSAIKVGGVRSYAAARAGKEVALEARKVTVYAYQNIVYSYPLLSFAVHVGSGTYIRSLARDIGKELGTGGYLSELRRTEVGAFRVADAVRPENISSDEILKNLVA